MENKEHFSTRTTDQEHGIPRHPKSRYFVSIGLFDNITSFTELELRIETLPLEERGPAFEVFAEAYFATQRIALAKTIWPGQTAPSHILRQLGMPSLDKGIDGIFETVESDLVGYQVKFRTGRPSLSWTELSTFFGLADRVSSRVLFTNCDELSPVVADRVGFYPIRGNDLDRLEPSDFEKLSFWLSGIHRIPTHRIPLPHQVDAIRSIISSFETNDRATAVLACGTGKTLIGLWVAEALKSTRVLVLVPSLALLRQTLHEWLKETSIPELTYLCVCTDRLVSTNLDELIVHQSDLDFGVTTKVERVREFLDRPFDGVKVIFSTYQSARVVAAAMSTPFDLAIFDEAHRTAGRVGTNFTFALDDENLSSSKRLFMTATPRHWSVRTEGNARLIYSMDSPDVYGPIVYRLPFAEAAAKGIICNYKVLISVITSEELNNHLLSRSGILIDGDEIHAKQVANQVAIAKAVKEHPIRRIFSFHASVASAKSFTGEGSEGIATHLPSYQPFHVNGTMPTAARDKLISEFRSARAAIMSNARCLTEGVDVPSVDMVALLSPRRSRVDIVQAAGRAMRKSEDGQKSHGYILVPLLVEIATGESIEEAVNRTGFADVWEVLHALQEHDDVLDQIIQDMQQQRGERGGFDDGRFKERVEILAPLGLHQLAQCITAACVDTLADQWELRYGELKSFKTSFGHCNVHIKWPENPQLGRWVFTQRQFKKRGLLSEARILKLNELGLIWDPREAAWDEMYQQLLVFHRQFNHCLVPVSYSDDLNAWVVRQRSQAKTMLPDRKLKLDSLGFVWDRYESSWEEYFSRLLTFHADNGHCKVPSTSENKDLCSWISRQRAMYASGELQEERQVRLQELGLTWDSRKLQVEAWDQRFAQLVDFKELYGHCDVPSSYQDNPHLGRWLTIQRKQYKAEKLLQDRRLKLEQIGVSWDPLDDVWEQRFNELAEFKNTTGHCNVPAGWPDNPPLAIWVSNQRNKNKRLTEDRRSRLTSIGFDWDPLDAAWEEQFRTLALFKETNGHLDVPEGDPEFSGLVSWIRTQRIFRKKGKLDPTREKKLASLDFVWDPANSAWESDFQLLVQYKQIHGHCNVPFRCKDNPQLAGWVQYQRAAYQQGILADERSRRLLDIGLVLDPRTTIWEQRFAELEDFKEMNGHCNVPFKNPSNQKLAQWVAQQRTAKREGYISTDRVQRLEMLGFIWDRNESQWQTKFGVLVNFCNKHGHTNVPWNYVDQELSGWVASLRQSYRRKSLEPTRVAKLQAIGFDFDPINNHWTDMFTRLKAFREHHGSCNVPQRWTDDPKLSQWVAGLRRSYKQNQLTGDKVEQLEQLGFNWRVKNKRTRAEMLTDRDI